MAPRDSSCIGGADASATGTLGSQTNSAVKTDAARAGDRRALNRCCPKSSRSEEARQRAWRPGCWSCAAWTEAGKPHSHRKLREKLLEEIRETSNIQIITKDKTNEEILGLLDELIIDFKEQNNLKKIESLEKKLINNLDENSFSELIKLKSQLNRE